MKGFFCYFWILASLTIFLSCDAPPDTVHPITVDNYVSEGYTGGPDSVGLIQMTLKEGEDTKHYICTGTLIGKRTVLTASHCVAPSSDNLDKLFDKLTFTIKGKSYAVTKATPHPQAIFKSPTFIHDIAIIILSEEVKSVSPVPIYGIAPEKGQEIYIVGYGKTGEENTQGVKRFGRNTIDDVNAQELSIKNDSNICPGDSGGPTFVTVENQRYIAGVHSYGWDPCGNLARDMRVDVHKSWIKNNAQASDKNAIESNIYQGTKSDATKDEKKPCHDGKTLFDYDYCTSSCKCKEGQGNCINADDCEEGLYCKEHAGESYNAPFSTNICVKWEKDKDCHQSKSNFDKNYCSPACKCEKGQGDCDSDDECKSGLVCKANIGADFGAAGDVDVCVNCHYPLQNLTLNYCDEFYCKCKAGEGFCNDDLQCVEGLKCKYDEEKQGKVCVTP